MKSILSMLRPWAVCVMALAVGMGCCLVDRDCDTSPCLAASLNLLTFEQATILDQSIVLASPYVMARHAKVQTDEPQYLAETCRMKTTRALGVAPCSSLAADLMAGRRLQAWAVTATHCPDVRVRMTSQRSAGWKLAVPLIV